MLLSECERRESGMAKISVIVPVYKVENYLEKCVDSIRNQTFSDIEIILVNDGSPDKCGQMCDEYANIDSRIKVIHKENGGLSDARNAGLKIAIGDYIAFVDSDDYIEPDMLEKLYEACKKYHVKMAGVDLAYVFENKNDRVEKSNHTSTVMSSNDFFKLMLNVDLFLRTGVWNKLYEKTLFSDVCFPKGKVYEDVGTMYKLVFKCDYIAYISEPCYNYLKERNGAITAGMYSKKEYDRLEMNSQMTDFIKNNHPELLEVVYGYRAVNCHLSIVNSMIVSGIEDRRMINLLKKDIRKNIKVILKSNLSITKKIQVFIFGCGFKLYSLLYKVIKD